MFDDEFWLTGCALVSMFTSGIQPWATPQLNNFVSRWLFEETHAHWNRRAAYTFGRLFDRLFSSTPSKFLGRIRVRVPSFPRSVVASALTVTVLAALWYFGLTKGYGVSIEGSRLVFQQEGVPDVYSSIYIALLVNLLINCIADFFSFVETRYVIRFSLVFPRLLLPLVLFDLIFTIFVFMIVGGVLEYLFYLLYPVLISDTGYTYLSPDRMFRYYFAQISATIITYFPPASGPLMWLVEFFEYPESLARFILSDKPIDTWRRVFVVSTFLTSVWLWVHLATTLMIHTGRFGGRFVVMFSSLIEVKRFPLVALNLFGLVAFTIGYFLYFIVIQQFGSAA